MAAGKLECGYPKIIVDIGGLDSRHTYTKLNYKWENNLIIDKKYCYCSCLKINTKDFNNNNNWMLNRIK